MTLENFISGIRSMVLKYRLHTRLIACSTKIMRLELRIVSRLQYIDHRIGNRVVHFIVHFLTIPILFLFQKGFEFNNALFSFVQKLR